MTILWFQNVSIMNQKTLIPMKIVTVSNKIELHLDYYQLALNTYWWLFKGDRV